MIKKSRGRFNKKNFNKEEPRKPRFQRMSEEGSLKFKASRVNDSPADAEGDSSKFEKKSFASGSRSREERSFRTGGEKRPDNVNLSLSPRMLELAEEMALESKMPLRVYLTELLKYALLAHGKRQGKHDKYLPEFTSQNKREVGTWRPASENDDKDDSDQPRFRRRTSQTFGKYSDRKSGDRPFGDKRYKQDNKFDYKTSKFKRSNTSSGFNRWQSGDADKEGSARGASSRFGNKRRFDSTDKSSSSGFGDKRKPSGFAGKRSFGGGGGKGKFKGKSFQKSGARSKFGNKNR